MSSPVRALLLLGCLGPLATAPLLEAQDARGALEMRLEAPARLSAGSRGEILVVLELAPSVAPPLMITPTTEGPAIEVVRGRFTRRDAESTSDGEREILHIRIPFLARTAGTALVRVRAQGFECGAADCDPIEIEAVATLEILATP